MKATVTNHLNHKSKVHTGTIDAVKRQIVNDYPGFEEAENNMPTADFFAYLNSSHIMSVAVEATPEEQDTMAEFDDDFHGFEGLAEDIPQLDNSLNLAPGLKDILVDSDE